MSSEERMSSFEDQLTILEQICAQMSNEELPIEEGLRLYEKGTRIAKALERELTTAERKVEQLINSDFSDTAAEPRLQLFEERAEVAPSDSDTQST